MKNIKPIRILFLLVTIPMCLFGAFLIVMIGGLDAWAHYNNGNAVISLYYLAAIALIALIYPLIKLSRRIKM
jgi:hypothetical protein